LNAAIDLASDQRARLRILHIVEISAAAPAIGDGFVAPDFINQFTDAMRSRGRKLLDTAHKAATDRGVEATTTLVESLGGDVAHAIVRQATRLGADLIVLGTHGRRGLRRVLMGSDAESVLRQARTPVLLVRGPDEQRPRKRIAPRSGAAAAAQDSVSM
jgi:nucleotide-binding universal stress UspA family protein